MKKRLTAILAIILSALFAASNLIISSIYANTSPISLIDASVESIVGTASESGFSYANSVISDSVVFHSINDSVNYRLVFENLSDDDYELKAVNLSNLDNHVGIKNVEGVIKRNSTQDFSIEIYYKELIDDFSLRFYEKELSLSFDFEIVKSVNNPATDDQFIIYILATIALCSFIILLFLLMRNRRKRGIVVLVALIALVIPTCVSAISIQNNISLNLEVDFASLLAVNLDYGDDTEVIIVPYGTPVSQLAIPTDNEEPFFGWLDDNGQLFACTINTDVSLHATFGQQEGSIIGANCSDYDNAYSYVHDMADRHDRFEIGSYGYWSGVFRSTSWQHNPGAFGNCTWFVWYWRRNNMGAEYWLPTGAIGNARSWVSSLGGSYWTGRTPAYGAVMQSMSGHYGHVAVVVGVAEGQYITIQEMNYQGYNRVFQSTISWSDALNYNYIYEHK